MRTARSGAALLALLLLLAPARAQDRDARFPGGAERLEATVQQVAESARARTVLIYGVIGLGSGAVVTTKGVIVTNAHVVAAARYAVVQWADGRTALCVRRGIDYTKDLAVLEPVEPLADPVPAFELAPSRPAVGSWVLAIGHPGGLAQDAQPTVSLGRVLDGTPGVESPVLDYSDAIRSDAALFSGNSGGPLVDLEGRLVGINGSVDLEKLVSQSIPPEVVAERLETLKDGLIMLPGRTLKPADSRLLGWLYDLLDPIARDLPGRIAEASRQVFDIEAPQLPGASGAVEAAEDVAKRARGQAIQGVLKSAYAAREDGGKHGGLLGDVYVTLVDARHVVCKASYVADRPVLTAGTLRAERVAVSEEDDLALYRLSEELGVAPDAPHRPVGSLAFSIGPAGVESAGIVSAAPRSTSATLAANVQAGGLPPQVTELIEGFTSLVEQLGVEELKEIADQLTEALRMRQAFSAGTPPRSYRWVLSTDAPVPPSALGSPLVDRQGQTIGVTIGIAHHGTTYVVPMTRVREAFRAHVAGAAVPQESQGRRLF